MSGSGAYGSAIQNLYSQIPQNLGGSGSYPGMQSGMGEGLTSPGYQQPYNANYGHMGSYNTLAQDLAQQQTGRFSIGSRGNPFQYMPGGEASGRRGVSGYSGVGPFQNQGGGAVPQNRWQTSQPYSAYGQRSFPSPFAQQGGGGAWGGGRYGGPQPGGFGMGNPYGGFGGGMMHQPMQAWGGGMQGYGGGGFGGGGYGNGWGGGARSVQPAQQVQQYRNYRSPFAGGGMQTQYGPQMMY